MITSPYYEQISNKGFELSVQYTAVYTIYVNKNLDNIIRILIFNSRQNLSIITHLKARLYIEKAGSPVTSWATWRNGGNFEASSFWLNVVNVSIKMRPLHLSWHGALKEKENSCNYCNCNKEKVQLLYEILSELPHISFFFFEVHCQSPLFFIATFKILK